MDSKLYNRDYNNSIAPLISEIFTTESISNSGYVEVGKYRKNEVIYSPSIDTVSESIAPIFNEVEISKLPEYEKLILTNIIFGENKHLVVAGAMGSGKTSTAEFLLSFIKRELFENIDCIYIHFNASYHEENTINESLNEFREDLYLNLRFELNKRLKVNSNIDCVLKYISDNIETYKDFFDIIQPFKRGELKNKLSSQKVDFLFNAINNEYDTINRKLRCYLLILRSINMCHRIDAKFIIFYDNIDRFHPATQIALLEEIIAKNNISNVKSLVFMRRCTYQRFIARAAFEPKYIHHHGAFPINVILRRCTYWVNLVEESNLSKNLKEEYKIAVKKRLNYIANELEDTDSKLNLYINALAGRSIRIGLSLIRNTVINEIFDFDKNPEYSRELPIAIITPRLEVSEFDPATINVFSFNDGKEFSIVQLRILQLVSYFKKSSSQRNLPNIIRHIRFFDDTITDAILVNSFNNLMMVERPLIWVDSTTKINSINQLNTINEEVRFTEIGFGYYKNLIIDTDYYQKCVESISTWDGEYLPNEVSPNMFQRFDYIRLTLLELLNIDSWQMDNYNIEHELIYGRISSLKNISSRIIYNIAKSYLPRLNKLYYKDINERYSSFDDWLSLLINCLKYDPDNKKISNLIDRFTEIRSA